MKKIIVDTDIGSDIDDAFALAYLLSRDDVEILGITTVSGLPELRAQLADNICSSYGKNIPIYVGSEKSLSGEIRQPRLTKAQTAVAESNKRKFSKEDIAVDFMKSTIENNPNSITLVCMGQLTNVASLFSRYPHIPNLLKEMVIMGGRYEENEFCDIAKWGETEWNILCDIDAAKIVFENDVKNSIVVGVEQTCRFSTSPTDIKKAFFFEPKFREVSNSISPTVKEVYFHDVIAIYAWLFSKEVTLSRGNIVIDTSNNSCTKTIFDETSKGKHLLLKDFSPEKFFANYMSTVGIKIKY